MRECLQRTWHVVGDKDMLLPSSCVLILVYKDTDPECKIFMIEIYSLAIIMTREPTEYKVWTLIPLIDINWASIYAYAGKSAWMKTLHVIGGLKDDTGEGGDEVGQGDGGGPQRVLNATRKIPPCVCSCQRAWGWTVTMVRYSSLSTFPICS